MVANYISTIYDLNAFGIFSIKNAMVNSDKDDGIKIEVSFNGGSTFQQTTPNKNFQSPQAMEKYKLEYHLKKFQNMIFIR